MTNIEKIRAALNVAHDDHRGVAMRKEARAALAELERAATEPVAWIVGQQTMGGDVAEVLRWSRGTPPISVSGAPRPLYTAAQPAPGMPEVEGLRLRSVSQILIQEIGAAGPENAEDSARRACGVIQRQADQIVSADTRIAELEATLARQSAAVRMLSMSHVARAETMMQHAQVLHDQSNTAALESERQANALLTERVTELEQSVTVRDTEIARLRDALDLSALEYADLTVSARSLEDHLHALVEVSEDSTIARARAVMNGDDIGEDEDEARAGNGGEG